MLAVAKTPHIEFSFKGPKDALVDILDRLKGAYPIRVVESDSDSQDWTSTELHQRIKSRMHGGSYLRVDLFKAGSSQKALAEATGIPQPHISQMIAGKRPISHENAQKLGKFFKRPAKRYRVMAKEA
ncbi:MAG TPA: helix-turn-helix domain-containing protein [Fibrobacteria bacterium]|nr:helix-turn-helix domain-containing protein [Fibrobacteria bacterium]